MHYTGCGAISILINRNANLSLPVLKMAGFSGPLQIVRWVQPLASLKSALFPPLPVVVNQSTVSLVLQRVTVRRCDACCRSAVVFIVVCLS